MHALVFRSALAVTHKAKRRTLLPEDVVEALDANGFSAYRSKVIPIVESKSAGCSETFLRNLFCALLSYDRKTVEFSQARTENKAG